MFEVRVRLRDLKPGDRFRFASGISDNIETFVEWRQELRTDGSLGDIRVVTEERTPENWWCTVGADTEVILYGSSNSDIADRVIAALEPFSVDVLRQVRESICPDGRLRRQDTDAST